MTQYLDNMKIGDTILFRGPTGRLFYHGPGTGGSHWASHWEEEDPQWFHCSRKLLRCEAHDLALKVVTHSFTYSFHETVSTVEVRM